MKLNEFPWAIQKRRSNGAVLAAVFLLLLGDSWGENPSKVPPAAGLAELSQDIEKLSDRVRPAVVQVFASGFRLTSEDEAAPGLVHRVRSGGSGVILDPVGHIVTNAHVVEGAARVEVLLAAVRDKTSPRRSILQAPGKKFTAEVLGIDRETDLAVLKIPQTELPHLQLADSDLVKQGSIVLAFGSPLGLESSVTMGVVSATARQLRPEDPMIYMQTDCPINPGSSGGPLVDLQGRVVGINTFILSQSGGNEGIGFAAPSNIVHNVFDQIRRSGRVRRGTIGINAQTITPELAAGLELATDWGVILGDVLPGGPAAKAGLREGDVILTLNGKVMENARQMEINLYRQGIDEQVSLEVQRGSQKLSVQVPVAARNDDPERFTAGVSVQRDRVPGLGILAFTLDAQVAQALPPLRKHAGVLVAARVAEAFPGDEQLLPGDVIYAVNRTPVTSLEELRTAVRSLTPGKPAVIQLERAGKVRFLVLPLEENDTNRPAK
jgi:serine protease Do